jgi:hypothetical protein
MTSMRICQGCTYTVYQVKKKKNVFGQNQHFLYLTTHVNNFKNQYNSFFRSKFKTIFLKDEAVY